MRSAIGEREIRMEKEGKRGMHGKLVEGAGNYEIWTHLGLVP
jgi:hypothetical protein